MNETMHDSQVVAKVANESRTRGVSNGSELASPPNPPLPSLSMFFCDETAPQGGDWSL